MAEGKIVMHMRAKQRRKPFLASSMYSHTSAYSPKNTNEIQMGLMDTMLRAKLERGYYNSQKKKNKESKTKQDKTKQNKIK